MARDCLVHLTPPDRVQALDGLPDEMGEVSREVVERLVTVAKDTAEAHGRWNADSGVFEPAPVGRKASRELHPLSFREGAEQALEQGHRRMITPSDDPEDTADETAGISNREFCVDPERAIEAMSSDPHTSRTRELHQDLVRAAEDGLQIPADPERAFEIPIRTRIRILMWIPP